MNFAFEAVFGGEEMKVPCPGMSVVSFRNFQIKFQLPWKQHEKEIEP